jgi:hypothetical protein
MSNMATRSRIQDAYSIGRAYFALAGVARDDDERARHIVAARKAWLSIGRDDLVSRWLDGVAGQREKCRGSAARGAVTAGRGAVSGHRRKNRAGSAFHSRTS